MSTASGAAHRKGPRRHCNAWSYHQSYASLLSKSETLSGQLGGHLTFACLMMIEAGYHARCRFITASNGSRNGLMSTASAAETPKLNIKAQAEKRMTEDCALSAAFGTSLQIQCACAQKLGRRPPIRAFTR